MGEGQRQWQESREANTFLTPLVPKVRMAVPEQLEDQLLRQPVPLIFPIPFLPIFKQKYNPLQIKNSVAGPRDPPTSAAGISDPSSCVGLEAEGSSAGRQTRRGVRPGRTGCASARPEMPLKEQHLLESS